METLLFNRNFKIQYVLSASQITVITIGQEIASHEFHVILSFMEILKFNMHHKLQ